MYTLNDGIIIESFQSFLNDLDMLTYASYLNELIDISMVQEESNRELFKEYVITLYLLKNKIGDLQTLIRTFEIKLLNATGYRVNFERCCICGNIIKSSDYINLAYYGGVCSKCEKANGIYIDVAAYNTLKYLSKVDITKVYRIELPKTIKQELYKVLDYFICQNYSKRPKSLDMLKFIEESEKDGGNYIREN